MKLIKTRILKGIRIFLMIFFSFQYFYGMKKKSSGEEFEINNNKQEDKNNEEINVNHFQYFVENVNPQDQKKYDQESNKKYICNYCYYCCCC